MQKSSSLDQTIAVGKQKKSNHNGLKVISHTFNPSLLHAQRFMEGFKIKSPISTIFHRTREFLYGIKCCIIIDTITLFAN